MNYRAIDWVPHVDKAARHLCHFPLLLGFCLFMGTISLQAQEMLSQEAIASHLMTWVPPVYPAIAQAAQVQGDVVVEIG
jgi:outer membrane biosynthesis protein TonB